MPPVQSRRRSIAGRGKSSHDSGAGNDPVSIWDLVSQRSNLHHQINRLGAELCILCLKPITLLLNRGIDSLIARQRRAAPSFDIPPLAGEL